MFIFGMVRFILKVGLILLKLTNSVGCDSIATLNLTINNISSSSFDATACDSYDWNGVTYTESGTYTLALLTSLVVIQQQL